MMTGFIVQIKEIIKKSILITNIYTENSTEGLFDKDIFLQGTSKFIGAVVCPIPNIKEYRKYVYPACVYIMKTKANV